MTDNTFQRKYEFALGVAEKVIDAQASTLASGVKTESAKGRAVVLFNNLSFVRTAPVSIDVRFEEGYARQLAVKDYQGTAVPSQLTGAVYYPDGSIEKARVHFVAEKVPSMGLKTYYLNASDALADISRPAARSRIKRVAGNC